MALFVGSEQVVKLLRDKGANVKSRLEGITARWRRSVCVQRH
jgi:hypothetical protein